MKKSHFIYLFAIALATASCSRSVECEYSIDDHKLSNDGRYVLVSAYRVCYGGMALTTANELVMVVPANRFRKRIFNDEDPAISFSSEKSANIELSWPSSSVANVSGLNGKPDWRRNIVHGIRVDINSKTPR
jgi:hypothetical protein